MFIPHLVAQVVTLSVKINAKTTMQCDLPRLTGEGVLLSCNSRCCTGLPIRTSSDVKKVSDPSVSACSMMSRQSCGNYNTTVKTNIIPAEWWRVYEPVAYDHLLQSPRRGTNPWMATEGKKEAMGHKPAQVCGSSYPEA